MTRKRNEETRRYIQENGRHPFVTPLDKDGPDLVKYRRQRIEDAGGDSDEDDQ
jgi:hypothetical protein